MKRQTIGVFASLVVAAALISTQVTAQTGQAGQAQAQAAAQVQKPAEVTLTGCLIQGSTPTTFVLDKAKKDPASRTETTVSYVLISKVENMDLTRFLNHQVRVTGAPDPKAPPANPAAEKDLPRLTASAIVNVADTCASPSR
jgi:hypothetical protein